MQPTASGLAQARATVYHALAESLVSPVPDLPDALLAAARTGGQVLDSEACLQAAVALESLPLRGDLNLRQQYAQVMTPHGRRPVALYESLHRHGRLMGQAALEVEQIYRGLGVAPVQGELPDHASVELAFLGSLSAAEAELAGGRSAKTIGLLRHEQRRFLREHVAAWLPEIGAMLSAGSAPFYCVVGSWLRSFLREELAGRQRQQQAVPTPHLDRRGSLHAVRALHWPVRRGRPPHLGRRQRNTPDTDAGPLQRLRPLRGHLPPYGAVGHGRAGQAAPTGKTRPAKPHEPANKFCAVLPGWPVPAADGQRSARPRWTRCWPNCS